MTDLFQQNNTIQYFQNKENEEKQNQINMFNNFVSPEFLEQEKAKGKVTAFETLKTAKKWGYAVPYAGTSAEITNNMKILNLQDKVKNGVQLTPEETEFYKNFILDMASLAVRGQTIPAMAIDGLMQTVPYMAEFGVGLAATPTGIGLASLGQTGTKLAARQALKQGVKNAVKETVKKQLAQTTAKTLIKDSTLGIAKFNLKYLPQQGVKRFSEIELDNNLLVTPEGQILLNEAETNPATSVLKAIGLMQIETLSETAGYAFNFAGNGISKFISSKVLKHLPEKFITNLNKLTKQVTGLSSVRALEKYGWNGILEEFGEERVSDLLQTSFDLDGQEGYSFEQFLAAMFPEKEQAISELLSFAIMGGTATGIKKSVDYSRYKQIANNIKEQSLNDDGSYNTEKMKTLIKNNNPDISDENLGKTIKSITEGITKTEDYSVDDFLLDSGVFRLHARKSNTDERITKILQDAGVDEEEIQNVLDYASMDDKAQMIKIQQSGEKKLTTEEKQRADEIKNDVYNKLVDAGIEDNQASNLAITAGTFFERYATGNEESRKVFDNFINNLAIRYNIPANNKNLYTHPVIEGVKRNQKVKVVDLSSEFSAEKNLSKDELTEHIKSLIGSKGINSKDKKAIFSFVARSKRTGKANVYVPSHIANSSKVEKNLRGERNTSVKNIINILQKSILIEKTKNNDKKTKPNVDNYLRFYVPVKINNNIFTVRVVAENNEKKNLFNILNADVYDVIIDKKMMTSDTLKNNSSSSLMKSSPIDSINDNTENFNPDEITVEEMLKDVKDAKGDVYFQSAYHGSPYKFDKFSTEHIGTGEGAQAHGWGLYTAKNKYVAEEYYKKLSERIITYNGKKVANNENYFYSSIKNSRDNFLKDLKSRIDFNKKEIEKIKEDLRLYPDDTNKNKLKRAENSLKESEELYKNAQKIDTSKIEIKDSGQLYEVDIPKDDVLLDEDELLSEQNENIQNLTHKVAKQIYQDRIDFDTNILNSKEFELIENVKDGKFGGNNFDYTGKDFYKSLAKILGSKKEASLYLNDFGIKGITYDGKQDGRCYVIFDDNAVNTIKTYYQEVEEPDEDKLIAGYTFNQVMDKLIELNEKIETINEGDKNFSKYMTQIHILEDAFDIVNQPDKHTNPDENHETMLNVYYIMNNQEIPETYIEADQKSQRTFSELKEIHDKRKEENELKYRGYFYKDIEGKPVVTIMQNRDGSTALHEFGHLYLDLLNELAQVNEEAKTQLDAVNKWLGYSGEYTTRQHEKFANNFVAYLYNGKAPNTKLKTVFENFKEWLKSVYQSVLDIPDVDISPEVQELFDNIFGGDEYIEQKKQANELLKKVKNISQRELLKDFEPTNNKNLDDRQLRHKEAAYEIVSIATGKSVKYLKNIFESESQYKGTSTKRSNVQKLLENVNDKITLSGGMRDNWREFYTDTGIGYENGRLGGDYELAEKAFFDIINGSFRQNSDYNDMLSERADYFAKEIDKTDRQYKVLLRAYKKENRNIALSAIYEWLDNLSPDIKQDYEDRFIYDSAAIERNENTDKFDKAKREIISRALKLENQNRINENEKYRDIVQQIVRSLDFLQPTDKAKLTANILDTGSTAMLMARIDSILDIAKTMEDVNLRRNLEKEIHKELQGTKNVKKNGRSVGKYDYRTNKIFEELRELDRLTPEKANEMRFESKRFAEKEDNGLSFKDKLINKFLSYKAAGRTFADTELIKSIYDQIVKIKLAGKTAKSELELMDKLSEEKDIEELINILENKKEANLATRLHLDNIGNFESLLNAIWNKNIKEKFATELLFAETQAQTFEYEQKRNFEREVAKIYNLPEWNWDKQIIEYLGQKYTYSEKRRKYNGKGEIIKERLIDRTLTKMDIIQAYIWSKNDILEKRLINQFGEDTLYSMFDKLSSEDEQLAELMMNLAQSFYPLVNKTFIEKYGLDLPKVSCYFPSTPERGSEVDLYNEYSSQALGNGFTKSRANSEIQAMDFHNPIATLYSHIDGVAKFVFMSSALDKANLRFRDKDLKRAIINKYDEDVYKTLEKMLLSLTYKSESKLSEGIEKIIDNMTSNWTVANIALKPNIAFKQFISANNYALDMPYAEWSAGFIKSLVTAQDTIDYMWKIPYVRARFGGSYSSEYLKQSVGNKLFSKTTKMKDAFTIFLRLGDAGSLIFGGKPYIDYLINKKGMSEEQAIKQFIIQTNRYQQSSATSSLGMLQINASKQGWARPFTTYRNQQFQYLRGAIDSLISCANGDITKVECAKTILHTIFLQPFIFNLATSGSLITLATTGDDDDFLSDVKNSIFNLGTDAIAGLDIVYKTVLQKILGEKNVRVSTIPLWGDIQKEIMKLFKEDVSFEDYIHFSGYIFGNLMTGIPVNTAISEAKGIGTMLSDDFLQGLLMLTGISEKRAEHISGEK